MIRIIDYGVGNLFSLKSSLRAIGIDADYTGNPAEIRKADKLILPGVGAFRDAREALRSTGLDRVVQEEAGKGKPLMGICLGMQMLFDRSYEYGEYEGLGLIPGEIVPMEGRIPKDLPIPHIGWNELMLKQPADEKHCQWGLRLLRAFLLCGDAGGVRHRHHGLRGGNDRGGSER